MSSAAAYVVPALTGLNPNGSEREGHTATVIMVHGLGDSGKGWLDLPKNWRGRNMFDHISFVFPNAPSIPITVNMGMRMPGWYDISEFPVADISKRSEDEEGILRSRTTLQNLIDAEGKKGVPPHRVVLGGFSQGGAMALLSGLTHKHKLGGVFGLSCYMLMAGKVRDMVPEGNPNEKTKVFMGHGEQDPVVQFEWGKRTAEKLKEWGWEVDFKSYPGLTHAADPKEIDDLENYIAAALPPMGPSTKENDKKPEGSL